MSVGSFCCLVSEEVREEEGERERECVCARTYVHTCVSVFVSFSLLGSYAKFVPDFIFVFLCILQRVLRS